MTSVDVPNETDFAHGLYGNLDSRLAAKISLKNLVAVFTLISPVPFLLQTV